MKIPLLFCVLSFVLYFHRQNDRYEKCFTRPLVLLHTGCNSRVIIPFYEVKIVRKIMLKTFLFYIFLDKQIERLKLFG